MAISSVTNVAASQSVFDANNIADQQNQQQRVQQVQQQQQAQQSQQQRDDDNKVTQQRVADAAYKPPGTGSLLDKFA